MGSNSSWHVMRTGELCGLFVFLWDRSMIRRACGDSCVEHDVCMKEHEVRGGAKRRVVCGGVRGDAKRRGRGGVRG